MFDEKTINTDAHYGMNMDERIDQYFDKIIKFYDAKISEYKKDKIECIAELFEGEKEVLTEIKNRIFQIS